MNYHPQLYIYIYIYINKRDIFSKRVNFLARYNVLNFLYLWREPNSSWFSPSSFFDFVKWMALGISHGYHYLSFPCEYLQQFTLEYSFLGKFVRKKKILSSDLNLFSKALNMADFWMTIFFGEDWRERSYIYIYMKNHESFGMIT